MSHHFQAIMAFFCLMLKAHPFSCSISQFFKAYSLACRFFIISMKHAAEIRAWALAIQVFDLIHLFGCMHTITGHFNDTKKIPIQISILSKRPGVIDSKPSLHKLFYAFSRKNPAMCRKSKIVHFEPSKPFFKCAYLSENWSDFQNFFNFLSPL